jgi:hypothetical protein
MNSKNKYFLKMDLSKLPTDIISYISAHLTDSTILDKSLISRRADTYLLYFFFHKNIPKDAKQYNKLLNDETQYYKDYDFTYNNKKDVTGILKAFKTKYKQLKLRTYDINFDKTKYDMYGGNSFWNISIYDNNNNNNNNVLYLTEYGFTIIENKDRLKNFHTKPYTKEEQDINTVCSYIKNDIKYFMKQCLTFRRLQIYNSIMC